MSDKRVFTVDKRGFVSDKPLLTDAVDVTFTYHESGFVPNKHVFMDGDGELPPDKHIRTTKLTAGSRLINLC